MRSSECAVDDDSKIKELLRLKRPTFALNLWFSDICANWHLRKVASTYLEHNRWVMTGRASFWLTALRGKGTKLGEREGSKLGEPCPKVRLSQDRLPIEPPFFHSLSGPLRTNVVRANLTSCKSHSSESLGYAVGRIVPTYISYAKELSQWQLLLLPLAFLQMTILQ
jgi:hypothetical protein